MSENSPPRAEAALQQAKDCLKAVTALLPGGGEERSGQAAMVDAVTSGIAQGTHVVVQAGTGTGKSLGYLVPAAGAGTRVVISTATKALQDQLLSNDLPMLNAALGGGLSFCALKGRANYLCRQRLAELERDGLQGSLEATPSLDDQGNAVVEVAPSRLRPQLEAILAWAERTETGDRAELEEEPSPKVWQMVSMGPHDCPGAYQCPEGERCFTEVAKRRAEESDVVVVNTHLYGAHLASGKTLLPEHQVVVFDEAHELEDIFSASLGTDLQPGRFHRLAAMARSVLPTDDAALATDVGELGDRFAATLAGLLGERVLQGGKPENLARLISTADGEVRRLIEGLRRLDGEGGPRVDPVKKASALGTATHLLTDLGRLGGLGEGDVAWVDGTSMRPVLHLAPIDLGPQLAELLWGEVTAVLTSATIPSQLATRVGLAGSNVAVLDVGSPFDYRAQALLYVATHLPDRRDPAAEPAIFEELATLITAAGGRTLALFTSRRAMEEAARVVRLKVGVPVMVQGELPKAKLLERFTAEPATCLFATMSFWQGVDVPGETLSLVAIDRLPFGRPDDPLLEARRDRAGADAFMAVDVPRAAALLAQGAGRLIRSQGDRGVVAVFDSRLATAGYRRHLLDELPPMRRTTNQAEVVAFLEAIAAEGAA